MLDAGKASTPKPIVLPYRDQMIASEPLIHTPYPAEADTSQLVPLTPVEITDYKRAEELMRKAVRDKTGWPTLRLPSRDPRFK